VPLFLLSKGSPLIRISELKQRACSTDKLRLALAVCLAIAFAGNAQNNVLKNVAAEDRPEAVRVEMRNVTYHFTDSIAAHIFHLQGTLTSITKGTIPFFDDKNSFVLAISSAEISIATDVMSNVLNQNVFSASDAPLKGIEVGSEGDALRIKGRLHSKGDIPFETIGRMSVTPDGEIRIHPEKVKAGHLPVKGLMDLLGLKISNLISTKKVRGIRTEGNDLLLNPGQILPPPQIQGRLTNVRVKGSQIIQTFGTTLPDRGSKQTGNYMSYRGAQLRFGKLTMDDTDMVLLDMDPQDPFDFYLDRYKQQLSAGYTKITPAFGLRVYMRDFNKLPKAQSKKSESTKTVR